MRCFSNATTAVKILVLAVSAIALLPVGTIHAQQVKDSQITVGVCAAEHAISISSPQDYATVNFYKVNVKGSVSAISQIDFYIDDVYDSTIALGTNQTTFEHDVSLTAGKRVIKLKGVDSCSGRTAEKSVTVTYQPTSVPNNGGGGSDGGNQSPPLQGGGTGGVIPPSGSDNPNAIPIRPGDGESEEESPIKIPGSIRVPKSVDDAAKGLDIDTSLHGGVGNWWRAASVAIGLMLLGALPAVMWRHLLLPFWHKMRKNDSAVTSLSAGDSGKVHYDIIMRLVGVALIVIPFIV